VSAVVTLGLLAAWSAPVGQAPTSTEPLRELAAQYRTVEREDAISTVALWSEREVETGTEALLEAVEAAAHAEDVTAEKMAQGQATLLAAAALLTEAARHARYRGDARAMRWELQAAARLVRARGPTGSPPEFAGRFFLVAGLMLHELGDLGGAYGMLSEGRRRAEDDAELLLELGAVSETTAALRRYEVPKGPRRPRGLQEAPQFVIEGEVGAGGPLPRASLSDAQALYERALKREPGLLEARLRLGRVLLRRGKAREALPELEYVGRESPRPAQRYMARMFEGRTRERLGDLRGAVASFKAATENVPRAQSALVGLGRALDRLGETARAQAAFDAALQSGVNGASDPRLDYIRGQPDQIDGMLEELRELVP
jgi:tetratricopeptide (TPR) repeat protein